MTEYFKKKKVKPTFGEVAKKVVDNIVDALDEKSPTATELVRKAIDASPLKITYDILSKTIPDSLRVPFTPTSKTPETPKVTSDTPPKELKAPEAPTTVGAPKAEISARPVKPVTASPVTTPIKPGPKYLSVQPPSGEQKPAGEVKLEDPASLARNARNKVISAIGNTTGIDLTVLDGISDEAITRGIAHAKEAVKSNKAKGVLPENAEEKYPDLVDGLAIFYAASEGGKPGIAKKAWEVAHTAKSPKLSSALWDEDKNDETARFYKDYRKKQGEKVSTPHKIQTGLLPNPLAEFIKLSQSKTPYVDFTSNGRGLDEKHDPDPIEVARLADYSYSVFSSPQSTIDNERYTQINGWMLTTEYCKNDQGLNIAVYRKPISGKYCYVVVNVGSTLNFSSIANTKETANDWSNNIQQPFGYSQDMKDSIEFAKKFVEDHPNSNIVFAGHSKGGAEAAANAVATGKKAFLFNPAKANFEAYGLDADEYDSKMTTFVVDGELLSELLEDLPLETIGDKIIIDKKGFFERLYNDTYRITPLSKFYQIKKSLNDHSMERVIESMTMEEKEKWLEELLYLIKTISPAASLFF